jgi:hypothetical protein
MHPEMWIVTHFFFLADTRLLRNGVDTPFLFSIRYISRLGYAHFYCQQGHLISSPCHVFFPLLFHTFHIGNGFSSGWFIGEKYVPVATRHIVFIFQNK